MNPFSILLYVFAGMAAVIGSQYAFGPVAPELDAAVALLGPLFLTAGFCIAIIVIDPTA